MTERATRAAVLASVSRIPCSKLCRTRGSDDGRICEALPSLREPSMQTFRTAFVSTASRRAGEGISLQGEIRAKRHVGQSFFDRPLASATSRLFRSRRYPVRSSAHVYEANVTVALRRDVDYISQSIYIIQDLK